MFVNDIGRPSTEPFAGLAELKDYKSWRRLAVAVRASVIKGMIAGEVDEAEALDFLRSWATDPSTIAKVLLIGKADPDVDDQRFPKVPMGAGKVLAMGGAKIFTDRVQDLVAYAVRGNDMVPEGEGSFALEQARARAITPPNGNGKSPLTVFAIGVGTAATAGLVVFAVTEILKALKGRD